MDRIIILFYICEIEPFYLPCFRETEKSETEELEVKPKWQLYRKVVNNLSSSNDY